MRIVCASLAVIALGGCQLQNTPEERPMVAEADVPGPLKAPGFGGENIATVDMVARDIELREAEYARVLKEARSCGMLGGALQGAILGLLIDASGTGVVAGAVVGGAFGYAIGDAIGSNVIQKHRNFLVREASLQRVIEAAKQDTSNTSFDLLLSTELVEATHAAESPDSAELAAAETRLETFWGIAVTRAVSLRELMPLYTDNPEVRAQLMAELEAQTEMISEFDRNIARLTQEEEEEQ